MSVVRQDGLKVELPRTGADCFWKLIHEHYAEDRKTRWKYLAMVALHENAGWPLDKIGMVFGHSKGHVSRCVMNTKDELHKRFKVASEWETSPEEPEE